MGGLSFFAHPVNVVYEEPLMMNKLCIIRDHESILTLDFWPVFLKMAAKLLFALNVCTPCISHFDGKYILMHQKVGHCIFEGCSFNEKRR